MHTERCQLFSKNSSKGILIISTWFHSLMNVKRDSEPPFSSGQYRLRSYSIIRHSRWRDNSEINQRNYRINQLFCHTFCQQQHCRSTNMNQSSLRDRELRWPIHSPVLLSAYRSSAASCLLRHMDRLLAAEVGAVPQLFEQPYSFSYR